MAANERERTGTTRRRFMKTAGATAAAAMMAGSTAPRRATGRVLGANDRIQIGFIACGGRGGNHMDQLSAMAEQGENIALVAGCDIYRPRLQARADKHKFRAYSTYQELLQDKDVDAVVIATPDHHHSYHAIDAIKAGKDVYCEKPVTHWRQFELTKQLAKEVAISDRVFMLGTQYMSDAAWPAAREIIASGTIGRIIQAEWSYFRLGDWGERGMRIDDPNARPGPDLDWEAFLGDAPKRPFDVSRFFRWRMYIDYSGGPSTDLYPHFMTQMIYMLGVTFPTRVVACGGKFRFDGEREVPDTFSLLIDYPEKLTLVITGTQGSNYPGRQTYSIFPSPIIRGWDASLTIEGGDVVVIRGKGQDRKEEKTPIAYPAGQDRFYREWFDAMRARKQPLSSAELAYQVQTTLQMAMMSWDTGKAAVFDPVNEKILLV